MINNTIFFAMNNPPAIIIYQDCSGYKAEIIQEFETSSETPINIIMDYISKQIDAIDKARAEMRQENPNFLPHLA